jgi:choline dehydrogenase
MATTEAKRAEGAQPQAAMTADYVIVGGGAAGAVLARRLSDDPATSVILLEAGHAPGDIWPGRFWIDMPVGMRKLIGHPVFDWQHPTQPDPSINGRAIGWHGGRLIGGSSAINGQIFVRGTREDYDGWSRGGSTGWSFDEVFPYFLRSERWEGEPGNPAHSTLGPLSVSPIRSPHPLASRFIEACRSQGLRVLDDYFAGDQDGAFLGCTNQRRGRRQDAGKAYLEPVRGRPNLQIVTNATVERVCFVDRAATGVEVDIAGRRLFVAADSEVVLSAGTVNSPAILLRSGVGPADQLRSCGIDPVHHNGEVGKNLQEHPLVSRGKYVDVPTYNVQMGPASLTRAFIDYMLRGRGMLTSPAVHAMAMLRTTDDLAEPDILVSLSPLLIESGHAADGRTMMAFAKRPGVRLSAVICRPYSRGTVRLDPADPTGRPLIEHRLVGDDRDLETLARAGRKIEDLFASPGLAEHVTGSVAELPSDGDGWRDWVRETAGIGYHPVGTCRMGGDDQAVTDPRLRVRGVHGLRVIDASIMPTLVSANTFAPVVMIAEKGADMIREDARRSMPPGW